MDRLWACPSRRRKLGSTKQRLTRSSSTWNERRTAAKYGNPGRTTPATRGRGRAKQPWLIVYSSDNSWVDLTSTAQFGSRWTRFGQQLDVTATGNVVYGWADIAPSAETVYLRLRHTVNPATGEQLLRAATSVDGTHWVWWGTRTLPAGAPVRVGLVAFDAPQDVNYTASFDYLHFYLPTGKRNAA